MTTLKYIIKTSYAFLIAMIFILSWSCSKTEITYEQEPYNEILAFRIATGLEGVDSLSAVLNEGNISIYWDGMLEKPLTIAPVIKLPVGATITPASGEAVEFSESTVYTVTAANGTTKLYRLKPIYNVPVPVVSSFATGYPTVAWGDAVLFSYQIMTLNGRRTNYFFAGDHQADESVKILSPLTRETLSYPLSTVVERHKINITGEYFLTGQAGSNDFRVFIRRSHDGLEIEAPIETLTENKIVALFPKYTSALDSGMHQLFFQMNGREFEGAKVNIAAPAPGYLKGDFVFHQQGQTIKVGDKMQISFNNIHDDYNGAVVKYYGLEKVTGIEYTFAGDGGASVAYHTFRATDFTLEGNTFTFIAPEWMANRVARLKLRTISFVYPYSDRRGSIGYNSAKKVFPVTVDDLVVVK